MAVYAQVEDVQAEYDSEISSTQIDYVAQKLTSAELILASNVGNLAALVTAAGAVVLAAGGNEAAAELARVAKRDAIKLVLCNMVIRLLRNPEGIRTQTAGPFSYTRDTQVASGRLLVSREDRRLLGLRQGAATVSLSDLDLPYVLTPSPHYDDVLRRSAKGVPLL